MKTTLDIDDALLLAAKQRALDTGGTLRQVVEDALAAHLTLHKPAPTPIKTLVWPPRDSEPLEMIDFSAEQLRDLAYAHEEDPAWWLKRFGFIPPGLK